MTISISKVAIQSGSAGPGTDGGPPSHGNAGCSAGMPPQQIDRLRSVSIGGRWTQIVVADLTLSQLVRRVVARRHRGDAEHLQPDAGRRPPRNTLTTTVVADEVRAACPASIDLRLETATDGGRVVLAGRATATLPE
jgi:hypothetical protein